MVAIGMESFDLFNKTCCFVWIDKLNAIQGNTMAGESSVHRGQKFLILSGGFNGRKKSILFSANFDFY
jgi:hypothetical protein